VGPGSERTVRARVVPFLEGEGIILLLEDVTETVRSNRLAAWAEMARRIAHEIKNPLTPIQLSAEHIRRVYAEGSPGFAEVLEECLMTIMAEVANLREISSEFSTYARIPTPRREPTDVRALLEEVVRPYKGAAPPGISLRLDLADDLPAMEVDRSLMGRALVNLIENALQAMPKGGSLSVRARRDGDHVAVEVADTGVGMDPVALGKIFEPYFSTKDTGTGLGLAIARKAVEEHGGTIEVASEAGAGTTMRILLPVTPLAVSG
jgi:two-component system nitrogen regulation sensor histidine kinase NtrY